MTSEKNLWLDQTYMAIPESISGMKASKPAFSGRPTLEAGANTIGSP